MAMESFSLIFDGYWRARNAVGIPGESGIYCVYACSHDATAGTVSLGKLIYIGESENVRDRIDGHERLPDWKRHLQRGEELCFSFAPILRGRERVEAALIPDLLTYPSARPTSGPWARTGSCPTS